MIFKKKSAYDWMVVGLGNPGDEYASTRHNAGFMAVDRLSKDENFIFNKNKMEANMGEFTAFGKRILVVKPQTFMNSSGRAVSKISSFYKIPKEKIIVMFDDISLDVGKIRIRRKGSHGGHNGIKDIINLLGTDDILRIKIGVGAKPHPDYDLIKWVLGKFPKEQINDLESALEKSCKAVNDIIANGIDSAMNKFNN